MRSLLILALSFVALTSQADMMAPATLDIKCVPVNASKGTAFSIVSKKGGSAVVIKGKAFPAEQLIAGTEGGPAYLQAVSNEGGFNITISGGDLVKAFDSRLTITNGTAKANVNLFAKNQNFEALCKGLFSFN